MTGYASRSYSAASRGHLTVCRPNQNNCRRTGQIGIYLNQYPTSTQKGTEMNARAKGNWQGMNWIRQEKRMAIYLRDGCQCAWCGKTVEQGVQLTLDHIVAHSRGGSNAETNLVTACMDCNRSRCARSAAKFSGIIAAYLNHGIEGAAILANVRKLAKRSLKPHIAEAKELMARRGSVFAILNEKV